jgi:hypothetical protein
MPIPEAKREVSVTVLNPSEKVRNTGPLEISHEQVIYVTDFL